MIWLMLLTEFFVAISLPVTFYKFYEKLFEQSATKITTNTLRRLIVYFACMSTLVNSRYLYYLCQVSANKFDSTQEIAVLRAAQLTP